MPRFKLGPNGGYYDPNDDGPDQFTPTPGQQYPGMPQPAQQPQTQPGGFQPPIDFPQFPRTPPGPSPNGWWDHAGENIPGLDPNAPPGTYKPWSESMPDGNGGYYNPGGHVDANGNQIPGPPPLDTSGWPRKQYPGGQGGPVPPWMMPQPDKQAPGGYQSLSQLGGMFGSSGGNVAPKSSGGIMGRAFPDLFKR